MADAPTQAPPTPQENFEKFVKQWEQTHEQYKMDYAFLTNMIHHMMELLKKGAQGTEEAFQIASMGVMPAATTLQGDTMGELAGTMNVGSAFQAFTTGSQGDINAGDKISIPQIDQFINYLAQAYNDIYKEMKEHPNLFNSSTANDIIQAITKICNIFGAKDPDGLLPQDVLNDLQQWIENPSKTFTNPLTGEKNTGQQNIQNLQSAFSQWNNSLSAQSQSLTAQEQFASNIFNQYMNACLSIFRSTQDFVKNMVHHQNGG